MIGDSPVAHRIVLRLPGRPGRWFIDIAGASVDAPQCLLARLSTRSRRGEEDVEITVGVGLRLTHRADHRGGPPVHPGSTPRRRGGQYKSAYQVRPDQRDLLGHKAADREPEDIDVRGVQRRDEGNGVTSHLLNRVGRGAGCGPDTRVVERYDTPLRGQG